MSYPLCGSGDNIQTTYGSHAMRIGVCTTLDALPEPLAGLEYVECTVGPLLCPLEDEAAFAERRQVASRSRVPIEVVNVLFPSELKTTGPAVDQARLDAYIQTACRRAELVGVQRIVFGSGASRTVPEGFDHAEAARQLLGHLQRWGPIAQRHGLVFVMEALNRSECNIVNSLDEAAELVRRADNPNVRMLADTYHMALEAETPDAISQAGELIVHAHCAQSVGRLPVGFGDEDHRPYFRALKAVGYDGRISIEANWTDFTAELPRAIVTLREQIDSA